MPASALWVSLLLLAGPSAFIAADDPVEITVEGGRMSLEPAWIRMRVRVERDPANRGLTVSAASEEFFTSSYEELHGATARRTRWVEFKHVPAGEYLLLAIVDRSPEETWRAATTFVVIARDVVPGSR